MITKVLFSRGSQIHQNVISIQLSIIMIIAQIHLLTLFLSSAHFHTPTHTLDYLIMDKLELDWLGTDWMGRVSRTQSGWEWADWAWIVRKWASSGLPGYWLVAYLPSGCGTAECGLISKWFNCVWIYVFRLAGYCNSGVCTGWQNELIGTNFVGIFGWVWTDENSLNREWIGRNWADWVWNVCLGNGSIWTGRMQTC